MADASVQEIAEALGDALQTIGGLRVVPYLGDSISPPVALIAIDNIDYHGAFGNGDREHTFTIFVIIGRASDRAGLQAMESYMSSAGSSSIRQALEDLDCTLGDLVSDVIVQKSGPPSSIAIGTSGVVYLSLPFTVLVHA